MKKVFLSLAVIAALTVVSCKQAETAPEETAVDSTMATAEETVDSAAMVVDSATTVATDAAATATEAAATATEAAKK